MIDQPRAILGTLNGFPTFNQSADVGSGTYILPSLEFSTSTSVEAWELYAESSGGIQLQVSQQSFL